ncbi:SusC/RagA family TonB-linked outer membrane protein [Cellulophaga sp. E6(2014)]|uniref:SusC/RagA family TonB-linked outer membrane protein n=1 Tax=Cellulophaga sp. E6(2014) TaxID=1495334 RepID=UPI00051D7DDC|nr:SusC/RagA family TonB-linked outer membrane protein [Cellulophaga sp. E6(2014)]KGK28716.1 membrane protein [Cellulophaga sp. E6(2014)]
MKSKLTWMLTPLLVLFFSFSFAQEKTITGNVTDQSGLPLPGVSVLVVGTTTGTQTDFDGNYSISAALGQKLRFSYIGQKTIERAVGASGTVNVQLEEDAQALEEVVVTGFGSVSKTTFAGSAKVVAGENISNKSFTNVSQALAGEAAGVNVINTTGQPGSTSTIRIRGFGSVNGNQAPLYIVDDAPFQGSLNDINPNDIKSVTVLKDASATSLYGARGANGVIVISTKRGGKEAGEQLNISVKTGTNFQGIGRYETISSPEEYIGVAWEGIYQRGLLENNGDAAAAVNYANANLFEGANADVSDISPIYNMWNTTDSGAIGVSELIDPVTGQVRPGVSRRYTPENWGDFAFQSSNRLEANVSASNTFENSSIYMSLGFVDDEGYASNTDYQRLNARVAGVNQFGDFITVNTSLNYAQSETNDNGTGTSSSSQFWWIDNIPSIYPLFRRDASGQKIEDPIYGGFLYDYGLEDGRGFGFATNGVADSQINISRFKDNSVNFNNDIKATLYKGLVLENNFAYQYFMRDDIDLNEPFYSPAQGNGGLINRARQETKNYTIRTGLRYSKSFEDFKINAFVSHVATGYEFNYLEAERTNLVTPFGVDISNGVVNQPSAGYTDNEKTESYIANVTMDYANKYFLNATFNRDASSRFLNNKWGNFYSVGAAWILSSEDFLSSSKFVNFLKLKASYGVLGNSGVLDADALNSYYPGYDRYSINNLNDNISLAFAFKGNPDLTWESSNQFNIGTEFELGNFVEGSVEFYTKNTTDMFFDRAAGPSVGYASIQVNDGELLNQGVEFDLDFKLIKNEKFKLNFGVNGAFLKNEFKALPIDPGTGEEQKLAINGTFAYEVGRSLYDRYIPVYAGVNPANGAALWERNFEDLDGNGEFSTDDVIITSLSQYINDNPDAVVGQDLTEVYSEATDKFVNKTAIPDITGSFRLNAEIGNFTVSTLFNYQIGGWAYDTAYANLMDNDFAGTNNFHVDIRDRWMSPGDITDIPRQDSGFQVQQNATSTRFLTDASFIALNNVRLGYKLPSDVVSKIGLKNLDFFITGDNLWLLSERKGFNPSTSLSGGSSIYTYSPLSTIVLGINLNL